MYHGEAKINGKWYYFDATWGKVAQGWFKLPDGRQVYYDVDNNGNGQGMLHGMQKVGNDYYYFNPGYGTEESGLKEINGKYYYFSPVMIKNTEKEVNGAWYYFGADGTAKIGWYTLSDGRLVNYNDQGQMYHGEAKINGKWYYFDATSGKVAQGWYKLPDGRQVYYDVDNNGNGQGMLHGMQKVGDNYYYFNEGYGTEESGLKNVNGKYYYFNPVMVKNAEKEANGSWYYFDTGLGTKAVSKFVNLGDGRTVYYDAQGHMVYGWQNINGNTYYFNGQDGNMYVGAQWINGQEYYFDYITGAQVKDQWTAKLLKWFFNRMGKLTYSMDGSRNGADGTADCSGSLTQALYEAGAWRYSLLYNTEMLHSYLLGNGYHLAYENNGYISPVVGDVIIWGQRGRSAGGAGHTGVISGSGRNGTMVSTCYWTEGEKGTAVQNFPYFWYWGEDNYPYYYVYRR